MSWKEKYFALLESDCTGRRLLSNKIQCWRINKHSAPAWTLQPGFHDMKIKSHWKLPGNHRYHKSRCILNTRAAKRASSHWGLILIHYLQLIGSFWKLHKHLFNMAFPDSPPPVLPSPSPRCHTVHFSSELERDHHGQDRMLPYFHFSRPPLLIEAWWWCNSL